MDPLRITGVTPNHPDRDSADGTYIVFLSVDRKITPEEKAYLVSLGPSHVCRKIAITSDSDLILHGTTVEKIRDHKKDIELVLTVARDKAESKRVDAVEDQASLENERERRLRVADSIRFE